MRSPILAAVAVCGLTACSLAGRPETRPAPPVAVQILAFNDFHGHVEPPQGGNGRIQGVDAGGAEFLATHIARLRADNPHTVVVSAGDNIGATPLLSALFHDEPAIDALNAMGLDVSTVGNHEFDEGWRELLRMQNGGCHPVDGCRGGSTFRGAAFTYLSANVRKNDDGDTLFPATVVKTFDGVSVGFIGLALAETPSLVLAAGVDGLTFLPEADAANDAARDLRRRGVHAIVVLIHQGGFVDSDDEQGCRTMRGGLVPILERLSDDIDVVVSGHTNRVYTCNIDGRLVTSAASYGRLVTDIDLLIDRQSGRIVSKTAQNVVVSRDVPPAAEQTAIVERYGPRAAEIGRRPVGSIAASVTRGVNQAGESSMGDVVADALLHVTSPASRGDAQIAFVNQGSLRAELVHDRTSEGRPHEVTYADVFSLLPFGNTVLVKTVTGDVLARLLEQQFDNPTPGLRAMLQVSRGFSYRYDMTLPRGSRVDRASITLHGRPVQPDAHYRLAMSDFLWGGGDGFSVAAAGEDAVAQGLDIDVFLEYLASHSPLSPGPQNRIHRVR